MRFVDTNLLLYAMRLDPSEGAKADCATAIIRAGDLGLSAQVLGEFYAQATRKSRSLSLSPVEALELVRGWCRFPVQAITPGIVQAAIVTSMNWQLSYWDGAIIEAARAMGCTEVLSEDMSDGRDYGGVVVRNPFRELE